MEKVKMKVAEKKKEGFSAEISHFSQFKGKPMVFISGSFFGGGFNISKNKVKAILDNQDMLKKFANGDFDEEIKKLGDDEVLKL